MTERKTLILCDKYERAFVGKAIQGGYVTALERQYDPELNGIEDWNYEQIYKFNKYKTKVLQMFLLYEKIIIFDPETGYDFSKLQHTGLVEIITSDDNAELLGDLDIENEDLRGYACFLKPFIISELARFTLKATKEHFKLFGFTPRRFWSTIFDIIFDSNHSIPKKDLTNAEAFAEYFGEYYYNKYKESGLPMYKNIKDSIKFTVSIYSRFVLNSFGRLINILDLSVQKSAALMQSDYNLDNIEMDRGVCEKRSIEQLMETYQILRIAYENSIGSLPKLNSIDDVLILKEKRRTDIKRLNTVLNEIEFNLRIGQKSALKTAKKRISKASKELSRGNSIAKVNKWITYLSLPVSIVEAMLGVPPMMGIATGSIGIVSTLSPEVIKRRNGWLQIIR